jgi:hypothetical protein
MLVVVPVAIALAVGAALVHGLASSGSDSDRAVKQAAQLLGPVTSTTPSAGSSNEGAARNWHAPVPMGSTAAGAPALQRRALKGAFSNDATRLSVTIPKDRLVHADASLQVSVKNHSALSKATNEATQIVASLGGYAQSVNYESSHGGQGNAVLQLRVPIQKAQIAIGRLANLGTLLSQQVSTKDLQQQLTHENNGIGSLKRAIAVYEQALTSGTLSASERVQIQIKLANARHAVTQLRRNRTATVQYGATSNISLLLTTRQHAFVVTHHHRGTRFGRLLGSAAHFLALEGIIVLYALIVIAPLLILGGLAWWVLRERRRREERLLASA